MLKIGIAGCLGRMGKELIKAIHNNPKTEFIGGFEHPDNDNIGKNLGSILNLDISYIVNNKPNNIFKEADIVIDFTTPDSTFQNIKTSIAYKTPIVIGTTGLSNEIIDTINIASKQIPIIQSYNMSIGVNIILKLVENASKKLSENTYDVEISEAHHRYKIDAPSGTALSLGEAVSKARGRKFDTDKILNRTEDKIKRKTGEIGFSILRAGEIAGEHTVSFISNNDKIELTHKALNRYIFVEGAIKAAQWLHSQKPGLYSMENVLDL